MTAPKRPAALDDLLGFVEANLTPSLTTEQARDYANRWAWWEAKKVERPDSWMFISAGPAPLLDTDERQLVAWVSARMAAHLEGWQDSHATAGAYLAAFPEARCDVAGDVADDLSWDHEGPDENTPAWALCMAAGWPS